MNELTEQLAQSFQDEAYRNAYAEGYMNSFVAAQIKTLREENDMTQQELAEKIGTKQAGISRLENVNYYAWKVETLRKLARAFGVRLKITFEEYGTLPEEIEGFNRDALIRKPFDEDPVFFPEEEDKTEKEKEDQAAVKSWQAIVSKGQEWLKEKIAGLGAPEPNLASRKESSPPKMANAPKPPQADVETLKRQPEPHLERA